MAQQLLPKTAQGFFHTLPGAGCNLLDATTVTGFSLTVNEPAHTAIRYAFKTDTNWYSLNTQGLAQNFASTIPTAAEMQAHGNTTGQLKALTDIPAFVGKQVEVAILLTTDDVDLAKPVITLLALNYVNALQQTQSTQYSAEYEIGDNAQIAECKAETAITGRAAVEVTARITKGNGTQTDWLPLTQLSGQTGKSIQFRGIYSVSNVGTGTAQIRRTDITYSDGSSSIAGQVEAELYSLSQNWYMDIKQCRLTVRHRHLDSSEIAAYLCIRNAPVLVQGESIGTGTGNRKTYQLSHTNGIKYDTVRLYYNSVRQADGYEVNTQTGRITCEAPSGVIITCDYEYGWEKEVWQRMTMTGQHTFPDYDQSEYRYVYDGQAKSITGIKLVFHMITGHTTKELCGTAVGEMQSIKLAHIVRDGALTLYTNNTELPGTNWYLEDDPQYVKVSAPAGTKIYATYDWVSEAPTVYQFIGVFSA